MILRIHKQKREHIRFYTLILALIVLLFARYGLEIGIPRIVLTGTIALIAVLGNRNEIMAIAMCCIPLHEAVDFFYAVVACSGVYVLKYHREIRINLGVILVMAMICWELLHDFSADFSLRGFLVSVTPLIFLAVLLCLDVSELDYAFIVRTMTAMVATICLVLLTNLIVRANFNLAAAIAGLRRLGQVTETDAVLGGAIHPNSLGIICVITIAGLMQLRAVGRNRGTDLVWMIILLVFGALTSSRTFLVCLLLMALLLVMAQPGDFRKKMRLLLMLALIAAVALLLLSWLFPELLGYYIKRFQVDDITTGRDVLMIDYHRFISDNPRVMFFGVGLQDYGTKLTVLYRVSNNVPHNSIQEIVVAWGLPGLLLIILLCLTLYRRSGKYSGGNKLLNQIPFLIIIAKSMAGQLLTSYYTVLALSYAYLSLCQDFTPKEER